MDSDDTVPAKVSLQSDPAASPRSENPRSSALTETNSDETVPAKVPLQSDPAASPRSENPRSSALTETNRHPTMNSDETVPAKVPLQSVPTAPPRSENPRSSALTETHRTMNSDETVPAKVPLQSDPAKVHLQSAIIQMSDEQERNEEINQIRRRFLAVTRHIEPVLRPQCFVKSFRDAIEANTTDSLTRVIKTYDGIMTFKMLTWGGCQRMLLLLEDFEVWCQKIDFKPRGPSEIYHNSMIVNYTALHEIINGWMRVYLQPLVNEFFPYVGELDSHLSFVVTSVSGQTELGINYLDDSDITLKICLDCSEETGSGAVQFTEPRCKLHGNLHLDVPRCFQMKRGEAVLHVGQHGNSFTTHEGCERKFLVIWCKSSGYGYVKRQKNSFPEFCSICRDLRKKKLFTATEQATENQKTHE